MPGDVVAGNVVMGRHGWHVGMVTRDLSRGQEVNQASCAVQV